MSKRLLFFLLIACFLSATAKPQTTSTPTVRLNVSSVQGMSPGYKPAAGTGLTLTIAAGTSVCAGAVNAYAGGTLTLVASATNYVYLDPSANCAPTANSSGFQAGAIPIATVVTGSSGINSLVDLRGSPSSGNAGGGAGVGACAANQFVTAINGGGSPTCAQPAFSNLSGTAAIAQLPLASPTSTGILQLAGDIAGSAASPTVVAIQGNPVSSASPAANQVLTWNGTAWTPANPPATGAGAGACAANQFVTANNTGAAPTCAQPAFSNLSGTATASQLPAATATSQGAVQIAQDFGGTAAAPKVAGLQGIPVSTNLPTNGQIYAYNGGSNQWTPATPSAGTVTSVGISAPPEFTVAGAPVTGSGTLTLGKANQSADTVYAGPASGASAAPAFRSLVAADLPAATSSAQGAVQLAGDLTGTSSAPKVAGLQGNAVAATAPAANQVLTWNGTAWAPATPSAGGGSGTAGGSNTAVQFNNSGAFGGDATNFSYNSSTHSLTLTGTVTASGFTSTGSGSGSTAWTSGALSPGAAGTVLCGANTGNVLGCSDNGGAVTPVAFIGGDLGGTQGSGETVVGLQGYPVANNAPGASQVLTWNGSAWAPATPSAGGGGGGGTTLPVYAGGMRGSGSWAISANQVRVIGIMLPISVGPISHLDFWVNAADASTSDKYDVGIYNSAGNLLADVGAVNLAKTGYLSLPTTQSSQTLPAGKYYLAFTGNATTAQIEGAGGNFASFASNIAVSSSSGGVLPATITPPTDTWTLSSWYFTLH